MDVGYLEKIGKLRKMFFGEDPSALATIDAWGKRIQKLAQDEAFFQTEAAQEIYKALKERAKLHMKSRLQKGQTPEGLKSADDKQAEVEWVLSLFNPNYEQELESLDKLMDAEITI